MVGQCCRRFPCAELSVNVLGVWRKGALGGVEALTAGEEAGRTSRYLTITEDKGAFQEGRAAQAGRLDRKVLEIPALNFLVVLLVQVSV